MAERVIQIQTSNDGGKSFLSKNTTLLFVFSPVDSTKLLEDQKLIAWKTLGVTHGTHQMNRIDYSARVGMSVLSKQEGNLVYGGQDQEFKLGEMRDVTGSKDAFEWGAVKAIDPKTPNGQGLMQAYNKTNGTLTLYVGLYKVGSKTDIEPALLFEEISVDQAATVELTPMLRVYSTADYKATQILRGAIQGYLGEWNLAKLRGPNDGEGLTKFTLWEDAHDGNKLHLDSDMDHVLGVRTAS